MQYNMITRAQIRRQLRKNGGIMNVIPRQEYGLGDIVKSITKPFKKVLDVGKQVIKSPVGKAALLGLGGAGLMGYGPMSGLSGIGARIGGSGIGQFFKGMGPKLFGTAAGASAGPMSYLQKGVQQFTPGLLGKLGLTKGGGSLMPTVLGGVTAAGLMTYFMQKGKTEEEATQLAQDVKRGKGLGLDLIKADISKYRTGNLSASQMFDKGYHFLTPRDYIGAKGGRVNFQAGGVRMGNTLAENIAANKAQAAGIEGILAQGRSRLPGYTPQQTYTPQQARALHENLDQATGGARGVAANVTGPPTQDDISAAIAANQGSQTTYTPSYQTNYTPTYRNVSPEAQALNMSQATYEDITRSGADPRQYYMDYQNRMLTEAGNPNLMTYGQVIGGPMGGMGPGMFTTRAEQMAQTKKYENMTQAERDVFHQQEKDKMNQMMLTNPGGYADFNKAVSYYGTNPYGVTQEEIKDMVEGRDTGYMSAQDYLDQYVLGLSGQGIAEKYNIPYNQGGRVGLANGTLSSEDVGKYSFMELMPEFKEEVEEYKRTEFEKKNPPEKIKKLMEKIKKMKKSKKEMMAQGGRISLYAGGNGTPLPEDPTKPINPWAPRPKEGIKSLEAGASSIKVKGDVRPENMKMAKNISRRRLLEIYNDSEIEREMGPGSSYTTDELHEILLKLHGDMIYMAQGGRIGKYGGGIGVGMPSIPTGMPRVNTGGIRELDYRQSGGFVPVGVKEKADDVPAMLSKNEFVMTADAVKGAGGGSVEKGAQRMYDTMKRLEGKVV